MFARVGDETYCAALLLAASRRVLSKLISRDMTKDIRREVAQLPVKKMQLPLNDLDRTNAKIRTTRLIVNTTTAVARPKLIVFFSNWPGCAELELASSSSKDCISALLVDDAVLCILDTSLLPAGTTGVSRRCLFSEERLPSSYSSVMSSEEGIPLVALAHKMCM